MFFSVGRALRGEAADDYTLLYARMATYLRPDHTDAVLLSAELLDSLGQYDLAVATYKQVPKDDPDYYVAELGRAEALRRAAKPDAAIEVLEQLARSYPSLPAIQSQLGDLLRQEEDYAGAVAAYDKALEHTVEGAPATWFLHYARGISHERLGNWDEAEADFREALELNPDQPQVLNYLGYSMVEKQINLDEALEMIERAVAARPDSGYIVDSLGWVLYRLGRYDEAVEHMETRGRTDAGGPGGQRSPGRRATGPWAGTARPSSSGSGLCRSSTATTATARPTPSASAASSRSGSTRCWPRKARRP